MPDLDKIAEKAAGEVVTVTARMAMAVRTTGMTKRAITPFIRAALTEATEGLEAEVKRLKAGPEWQAFSQYLAVRVAEEAEKIEHQWAAAVANARTARDAALDAAKEPKS